MSIRTAERQPSDGARPAEAPPRIVEGLNPSAPVHLNLGRAVLVEQALKRGEGNLTHSGAVVFRTGTYTGRSPKDKFLVREPSMEAEIDWGSTNQPFDAAKYDALEARVLEHMGHQ
ncbi:MAG TPA: phosphoenolpyruvate carboxykinase (ATP), partial [Isosphaeraceae bacterium]|nr:phosphoenolpyruvate carboxykinase (ATP) [Isosphaeraceae bacterium]